MLLRSTSWIIMTKCSEFDLQGIVGFNFGEAKLVYIKRYCVSLIIEKLL